MNDMDVQPVGRVHLGFGRYQERYRIEAHPEGDAPMPQTPFLQEGNLFEDTDGKVYKILTSTLAMDRSGDGFRYRHVYEATPYTEDNDSDGY